MDRRTAGFLVSAALVTLLGATASPALGHTNRIDTRLTGHFVNQDKGSGDYFDGRVISRKAACERDRRVRVHRAENDVVLTHADSAADGTWFVAFMNPPNGTYYARVGHRVLKDTNAHKHVCKPDRSANIVVAGQP